MVLRRLLLSVLTIALTSGTTLAQDLRDLLPNFIRDGVTLKPGPDCPAVPDPTDPNCHEAHFEGAAIAEQVQAFQAVNIAIGQQLSTFPLPSSSGGFTYTYDPQKGTFVRGAESFGPIYAERADTIGACHFNLGLNYSHFSYNKINDIDLNSNAIDLLLLHATRGTGNYLNPWFRGDVIEGTLNLSITSNVGAFVANYGITDRFDIGLAIPVESVSINAQADLTIDHLSTAPDDEDLHEFDCTQPNASNCSVDAVRLETSGSASGIGDIVMRMKYRLTSSPTLGLALGTDARFPTGDEKDLLGTGVFQIKAFLIGSAHFGAFSPHLNAGYTWAIHRCLGLSDPANTNNSARDVCEATGVGGLPDEINYTGGFDIAFGPRVTFAADVIGRTYLNTIVVGTLARPLTYNTNSQCTNPADCPNDIQHTVRPYIGAETTSGDINTLTGSVGFKINPFGNFLIDLNGLFALNNKGLVDNFTPMIGIDWAF